MVTEIQTSQCKNCSHPIKGRSDKQFCSDSCRNWFNNAKNKQDNNYTRNITAKLKRNRSRLRELFGKQKTIVSRAELDVLDFNWEYHTHCKTNKKGATVTFCFDYGFHVLPNNKIKIIYNQQSQ